MQKKDVTGFTVGQSVFQVKVAVSKETAAVGAGKTFRMELFSDGVQAFL